MFSKQGTIPKLHLFSLALSASWILIIVLLVNLRNKRIYIGFYCKLNLKNSKNIFLASLRIGFIIYWIQPAKNKLKPASM